jgi:hypothetical protein
MKERGQRMNKITLETTVVRADDLLATDLDGETILMSIEQSAYYGMEKTARRIWELVEKPIKVADLCLQLAEEYRVEPEVCEQDIITFLEELFKENLVIVE